LQAGTIRAGSSQKQEKVVAVKDSSEAARTPSQPSLTQKHSKAMTTSIELPHRTLSAEQTQQHCRSVHCSSRMHLAAAVAAAAFCLDCSQQALRAGSNLHTQRHMMASTMHLGVVAEQVAS
jgi:hypothetical protein